MKIDVLKIQKSKKAYVIEYIYDGAEVTLTISNTTLIDFIVENELNGYYEDVLLGDYRYHHPMDVLNDDEHNIIVQYLNYLHN